LGVLSWISHRDFSFFGRAASLQAQVEGMMKAQSLINELSNHRPNLRRALVTLSWRRLCSLLAVLLCYFMLKPALLSAHPALLAPGQPLVSQEIRYQMPEAGAVFLVWGIDGWSNVPEQLSAAGTEIKDGHMYTAMAHDGVTFVAILRVPSGATIDYVFLITKTRTNASIELWDHNGDQKRDFHTIASDDGVVMVIPSIKIPEDRSALVAQEIRYVMPEASEVFLVWGINGWAIVPEAARPPGTWIKKAVMYTPMTLEGDAFVAQLQVPEHAKVDYGFFITKKRDGAGVEVWESNDGENTFVAARPAVVEVRTRLTLDNAQENTRMRDVVWNALISALFVAAVAVVLARMPRAHTRRSVVLTLCGVALLGLALRLWMAWHTNQLLPNTSERLAGDETGYDYLAYALLQGDFFTWPARTPVYPLFLAACYLLFGHSYAAVLYIQAFVNTTAIPLTYLLAQRYLSTRAALLTAGLVALHPALIIHVSRLYTEAIYTPLLLSVLLSLIRALERPAPRRFAIAGALLAIATLCRPATVLMPVIVHLLLPRTWGIKNRIIACLVYVAAMGVTIAPWSYHNYRTYDTFLPLSVSTATLWQGSPEFYHLMEQRLTLGQVFDHQLNPDRNGGHDPFEIEGDRYFTRRALASIQAEPHVYMWYCLQKLAFFWIGNPSAEWPDYKIFQLEALLPQFPAWQIVVSAHKSWVRLIAVGEPRDGTNSAPTHHSA
jgi:dolichyl-phosphate-mannose-protein mannosyltransferase